MSIVAADVKAFVEWEDEIDVFLHEGLTLRAVDATAVAQLPFEHCKLLADGAALRERGRLNEVAVVRGVIVDADSSASEPKVPVVVKLATTKRALSNLVNEAKVYSEKLPDLSSGTGCVPQSYGIYEVINRTTRDPDELCFGCMILEDCGEPVISLRNSGAEDEVLFRTRLVALVYELHKRGITHNQIENRHVLQKNGWPYLIDFSKATFDHDCPRKSDNLNDQDYGATVHPSAKEFGCKEIYEVCHRTKMWLPVEFMCEGYPWTARVFLDNPWALADKFVDSGSFDELAPQYTPREALTLVHEAICDYHKKYLPERGVEYEDDLRRNLDKYCQEYENEVARRSIQE
ncbi:unnamed protein product [Peniophora sp. CBMAI 1063]|nr:unnamed protein product [Peniophora sp. CBMAI 1063]